MRRRVLMTVAVLTLAACGGAATDGAVTPATQRTPSKQAGAFPVTLKHAFGTTTVTQAPTRVVTWGWGSTDAAIALGVVPVAIPKQSFGGDAQGVLPWIRQRLERDGTALPTVLPDSQQAPVEAIAAARPDLILAPYSGITKTEYDLLSRLAPTVAYPDKPWATPWRTTIRIVGAALGRSQRAEALLRGIDRRIAAQAKDHPALTGKTVAMVYNTPTDLYVYRPADARVAFTVDLGLRSAPSVDRLANGGESFYYTLSRERLGQLASDVLVSYADTPAASRQFLTSPAARLMPQVRSGAVAEVVGTEFIAAVSPPTALSLTWGLERYVGLLSAAAKSAG